MDIQKLVRTKVREYLSEAQERDPYVSVRPGLGGFGTQHEPTDISDTMRNAVYYLEKTIDVFENAQAMAYNFGMEEEANRVFGEIWDFKTKIEELLAEQ